MIEATLPVPDDVRILIVEDEGIIARDIKNSLESLGYTVVGVATTGQEAMDYASLISVDLVLMDIRIRGDMDGIETAGQLRSRFDLPVIYLTSHADEDTLRRASLTEPVGYLVKPFTAASATATIKIALNRIRSQRVSTRQRTWLNTILRTLPDAVIATDYDGKIHFLNDAAETLTGWNSEEVSGSAISELVQGMTSRTDGKSFEILDVVSGRDVPDVSATILDRQGTAHSVSGSATPIRESGTGNISGTVWLLKSIPQAG